MWKEERSGKVRYLDRYTNPLTGKIHRVSVTLEKKNDRLAGELLTAKINEELNRYTHDDMTVAELANKYQEYRKENFKEATYIKSLYTTKAFIEILGADTKVNTLSSAYIRQALEAHDPDNCTRNERLTRLKAMLRWGYEQEYINDVAYLERLKPYPNIQKKEKLLKKFLEEDEIIELFSDLNKTGHIYASLSSFLLLSGLRIGEALALNWSDIQKDYIVINKTLSPITGHIEDTPKTEAANREVYIQKELKEVIRGISVESIYVFSYHGHTIDYTSYRRWLTRHSERAIGRRITPHYFRHTHCSLMIANGESLDSVARRLGHVDSSITKSIYLHYMDKIKENDRKRLDNIRIFN